MYINISIWSSICQKTMPYFCKEREWEMEKRIKIVRKNLLFGYYLSEKRKKFKRKRNKKIYRGKIWEKSRYQKRKEIEKN